MSANVESFFQLNAREHAALLVRAICGDALLPPCGDVWFETSRVARNERALTFVYECYGLTLRLFASLPDDLNADWALAQRETLSPGGAEVRWAHFVANMGRFDRAEAGAPLWSEAPFVHDGKAWRARRERHPSAVIDRLLLRDRTEAEERLQWLIGDSGALDVGESPRGAVRANVGDKGSE